MPESSPPKKSEQTRDAILEAACTLFAEKGFDAVGVRDIASGAGVNAALVIRYFGGKEKLFLEALSASSSLETLLKGPLETLGERLARYALHKSDRDPLLTLLRSTSSESAALLLRSALDEQFIAPLSERLEGGNRRTRAGLIAAQILGLAVLRQMVRSDALEVDPDAALEGTTRTLQRLIDGD